MTGEQICYTLRALYASEDKPEAITPLDLLQLTQLLLQHGDEKDIYLSQRTLATRLRCTEDTIAKSQQRLHKAGWIVRRKGGHRGRTNRIAVMVDKLPVGDLKKTFITETARTMGTRYAVAVKSAKKVKSLPKGHEQQYQFAVQKMLTKCGDDATLLENILKFAFRSTQFGKKAVRGAGELLGSWKKLRAAYDGWKVQEAQPQPEDHAERPPLPPEQNAQSAEVQAAPQPQAQPKAAQPQPQRPMARPPLVTHRRASTELTDNPIVDFDDEPEPVRPRVSHYRLPVVVEIVDNPIVEA